MKSIKQLRSEIDKIDLEIIKKIAQRKKVVKQIGKLKHRSEQKIIDHGREKKIIKHYEKLAKKYDLNVNFIKKLFKMIIQYSRQLQN